MVLVVPTAGDVTAIGASELLVLRQGPLTPGAAPEHPLRENPTMTQTPDPAGTRGAVDLSAVTAMTTPGAATAGGARPPATPGRRRRPPRRSPRASSSR